MKKILFPTAFSSQSKTAYRYTQKLAQYFGASITLLHVYKGLSPFIGSEDETVKIDQNRFQELEDEKWNQELERLESFAAEMEAKQFEDIPLDIIATDGNIVNEILEVQKANNFDLVVMGMRQSNILEKLFGNTTSKVIEKVNCNILVIPPNAKYTGMDKIIYGTAFQLGEESAIDHLFEWCEAFGTTLDILHVYKKPNAEKATHEMDVLMKNYEAEKEAGIISFQLLEGKVHEVIQGQIETSEADLLAIHKRKKGFWQRLQEGSLTKIFTEETVIPLLILK